MSPFPTSPPLLRYAAFTADPRGGNPAGVVLDARGLDAPRMQAIAAQLGDSETAFLVHVSDNGYRVRYFSPLAEVPFCGHATIASAIALARRDEAVRYSFDTSVGEVAVDIARADGRITATLTSVSPAVHEAEDALIDATLAALRWSCGELDPALPPRIAFAGARHLVLAARTRERLRELDYDFAALKALMLVHDLTTVDLVWRESATRFHARNPFPVGGIVEDPATGAAAAAFGAYLRALSLVALPAEVEILQGDDMGRPSRLRIGIDADPGSGIRVGGEAVAIPLPDAMAPETAGAAA
jgi:PhzF family phenazine biosynthesis protein